MAKDPVLPLYYNDLSTSTQDWSDEEFGAYVRLLIHQWRQGGLPNDYQRLTRLATSLDKNWPLIKTKFEEVDGLLKNSYMEDVRIKRAKHKEKQKDNANKRYQKSAKHITNITAKNVPLENEIEIEKEVLNIKEQSKEIEVIGKADIIECLFNDERYIEQLKLTHEGKNIKEAFEECYTHHSNAPNPPSQAWEWKQKLNTWLTIKAKEKKNGKDNSITAQGTIDRLNSYR